MKKGFMTLLLVSMLLFTGCGKEKDIDPVAKDSLKPTETIIKVDKTSITKEDFDDSFTKLLYSSPYGNTNIDFSLDKNYKIKLLFTSKAVNDLLVRHFVQEEAAKHNITVSDEEVTAIVTELSQRLGGKEKLIAQLEAVDLTEDKFRDSLREDLLANKTIDKIAGNLTVTDEEAKQYYEKYKNEKFNVPETVRISHILIKADPRVIERQYREQNPFKPGANPDQATLDQYEATVKSHVEEEMKKKTEKANALLKKVMGNQNLFEEIAQKDSEDRLSAFYGGDLGFHPRGKLLPGFDEVVFDPKKAQVGRVYSSVIQSPIGFHIVKITDHRNKGILKFESVKDDIKRVLLDTKKIDILTDFVKKKKSNSKIEFVYKEFNPEYIEERLEKDPNKAENQATEDIKSKQ